MRTRLTAAVLLAAALLTMPSAALGAVWREGTASSGFGIASYGGLLEVRTAGDSALTLPYEASTVFAAPGETQLRSVRQGADGSFLAASGYRANIFRIPRSGSFVQLDAAALGFVRPFDAFPLDSGGMLVVDRADKPSDDAPGSGKVVWLDASMQRAREYGTQTGPLAGDLWDPFTAEPIKGKPGYTLLTDSLGCRVIEIEDRTGAVVWSYGQFRKDGPGPGLLKRPHSAQRLSNGNTLICDAGEDKIDQLDQRVIEVDAGGNIVWSYGTGVQGSGVGQVRGPNSARQLDNGNILIADSGNNRVIEVDYGSKRIVEEYGVAGRAPSSGALRDPRAAVRAADGATVVADLGNLRLVRFGYPVRREYVATSGLIDPAIGEMKRFSRITVNAVRPPGATIFAEYTTDNRTWIDVPASGILPSSAKGSAIRYRLRLTAARADAAPVVKDVAITWSTIAPAAGDSGGSSSGSTHHSTASRNVGSTPSTSTATRRTVLRRGSRKVTASGSGSAESTTVAAGGSSSAIGGGTAGGSGGSGGDAVKQSTTLSGWVMSEVKDDVGGLKGSAGTGGFAPSGGLGDSKIPGVALMFLVYAIGVAWSPASKVVVRFAVSALTH